MSRVEIALPESFGFSVELPILISHINRGDHLGNESLIALLNEARVHFMATRGVQEYRDGSLQFINADLAVIYKSEGKYGESLKIEVAATAFHKYGCDLVYRVSERDSGREIAIAKTAHLVYDLVAGKPTLAPPSLEQQLS